MAIVRIFEHQHPKLKDFVHRIKVVTDYNNLKYFMITKEFSRYQARWSKYLSKFNFEIVY